MATNEITVDAPPARVFAVLSHPASYGHWVVGSKEIRDADLAFPAIGTRFHHSVGLGFLKLKDHTEVLENRPPARLVLQAKARPLGRARVDITLVPVAQGTQVILEEHLVGSAGRILPRRLTDPLIKLRNVESLRRLKRLAESKSSADTAVRVEARDVTRSG